MNRTALRALRQKLAADVPAFGLWVTLESPSITEMAVTFGADWVVIDAEHGHLDWKEIVEHLRAAARSETVALVRVAELNVALIKRALDIGADGVVVPWVETAEQVRQAVSFARYPPEGVRGIGAERATEWGLSLVEHTRVANDEVLVVPIIETVRTVANVPSMCQVDGVELFYFGPADFSSTAGYRGQWEGPGVHEQILGMKDIIRRAGKHCGLIATSPEDARERVVQGFRAIGLGTDAGLMARTLRDRFQSARQDANAHSGETNKTAQESHPTRLVRPPESFRPDRPEVMNAVDSSHVVELTAGVRFDCLVGGHNQARRLTTGIVTFSPSARLPYHTHEFTESVTVLEGVLTFEVEGRHYRLERLDNITIPRGLAHAATNATREAVVAHVAMASDQPTRTLVDQFFPRRSMPATSTGVEGKERVTRMHSATRMTAGPNTEFVDFFNADLLPGLEMSGGYGLFHPQGRLPAHVHDFDESICIIGGRATCVVEGRRYAMSDRATALQPRGRVHYFINETPATMEMIWVYAGPQPERIVVAEECATPEGNPWK